ncbi:MAG: cyclic nucleotide-binding domain-containing protein [Thaumarchaeota archaeon]|nr:MAG: cyclic nucleotide-binding domain-containing protein [Nitrososphaerota archaeon]TMQ00592.1 MAG: cyclic nucleotide-binding domain-containing protein [Nitrososphaerota archaeon]
MRLLEQERKSTHRLAETIGSIPLFSGLDKKDRERIAGAGREVTFEKGKTILREGEPGLALLLILEGKVEVRKKGKLLSTLENGGFFGEMTVIDDKPRSADVVAVAPTTCFGLTSWAFAGLVRTYPEIALAVMKELVRRLREVQETATT